MLKALGFALGKLFPFPFIQSLNATLMECLPYARSCAGSRGHRIAYDTPAGPSELMI